MSHETNLKRNPTTFLFQDIYYSLFKPKKLRKELEKQAINTEEFTKLNQNVINSGISFGTKSIEVLRVRAELGFYYFENYSYRSALSNLEKARLLEKENKLDPDESADIAIEMALSHLFLESKYERKAHTEEAKKLLAEFSDSSISNDMIRFKRDLAKSRILNRIGMISEALNSYEESVSSIKKLNNNNEDEMEALLYIEIAIFFEEHSESFPNFQENSSKYYIKAHKIFLKNKNKEFAQILETKNKIPQSYLEQLKRQSENSIDSGKIQFVSNSNISFKQIPTYVQKDIQEISKQIEDDEPGQIIIEYKPENLDKNEKVTTDDDDDDNDDDHHIEAKPVPKPSKITKTDISESQLFMITHNRLEVPTDTKPTSIKKMFHTTDETAEAVSLFNNSILNLSKMKNKTEVYDESQETEDPLERFRNRRRKKNLT